MRIIAFSLSFVLIAFVSVSQVISPKEYLGYEIGDQFSHHHQVVSYFEKLDETSPKVKLVEYGKTNEGRPLLLAFISSEENLKNLEVLRQDNLKRAKLLDGNPQFNSSVVWLSYNVHGNESSSTEASMNTIYQLLTDNKFSKYLENTVVIMDPCINPDGRERYVSFFEQWQNNNYNVDANAAEHHEPWPGGRENHYLFDLNRDWAWQTQVETQQRLKVYNQWMPQIHVDFHEQFINNPYYFAPATAPFHNLISQWQKDFQFQIGKNHSKYFDEKGWLYFTREVFDLLYPSYGDTYPTFNGAIGMTYEQAGHGMAGLGINIADGQILTLKDRVAHHTTTGLSTIEVASQSNQRMLKEFEDYFEKSKRGNLAKYKSFVIKNKNQDRINHLTKWLDQLGIQYGSASSSKSLKGYHYQSKRIATYQLSDKDLVIPTNQPKSVLAQVLFEPKTYVEDSLTYDITAWSAPFFYGLDAYANDFSLGTKPYSTNSRKTVNTAAPYALIAKWNSLDDGRFLAALHQENLKIRSLTIPTTIEGKYFDRGSLVITQNANRKGYEKTVYRVANELGRELTQVSTGFADQGKDLGSATVALLQKPKIAIMGGNGVSHLSYGQVRYFFEQDVNYPYTVLRTDYVGSIDLDKYNVLVFPSGNYGSLGEGFIKEVEGWVKNGGKLVLIEGALNLFKNNSKSALTTYFDKGEEGKLKKEEVTKEDALATETEKSRNWLNGAIPGAIYEIDLDNSHPLAFGLERSYYSLKTRNNRFAYLKKGSNVGTIQSKSNLIGGFVGKDLQKKLNETLVFGTERKGGGQMVYLVDNPLFRSFWYEGKILFTNAVFLVN